MTEYRVQVRSDRHYNQINGVTLYDGNGEEMQEFVVNLLPHNSQADILDVVGYEGGVAVTFAFTHAGVLLVLNESNEQGYFVDLGRLHNGHDFPTLPPITIHFIDSN